MAKSIRYSCAVVRSADFTEARASIAWGNADALITQDPPQVQGILASAKPFVVVKADSSTYDMGIMTVRDCSRAGCAEPHQEPDELSSRLESPK